MRFHLIDRIDEFEPGLHLRGRKLVSSAEEFWEHGRGGPVMPAPLVLEALCQAGTWLIMLSTDRRKRAALLQIGNVRFSGDVRAGDVLILDGVVESMNDEMAVLSGSATVDGTPVMQATDIMCALIDADDLEDPADSERMLRMLTRS
jgi:3-hydroxyacyl-[acyl-carrier-protein] dehydratase